MKKVKRFIMDKEIENVFCQLTEIGCNNVKKNNETRIHRQDKR